MNENKDHITRENRRVIREDLSHWKVLIVDDQLDNLLVAEAALKFHGVEACRATNGLEGLKALNKFPATLILLDLSMPEMDGWKMLEELKAHPEFSDIPVIALTAHVMQGDKERVLEAGFTGYIPKPFSVSNLIGQIQSILENSQV